MAKLLKKINRGLCLTFVVILVISAYLIALEVTRAQEHAEIRTACEEYLAKQDVWSVLPEEYRYLAPGTSTAAHISSLSDDIESYLSPNDNQLQYELDMLNIRYQIQASTSQYFTSAEKRITNVVYSYSDNQVAATLTTLTTTSILSPGSDTPKDSTMIGEDMIVLEKVGDEWKVIYSSLYYPTQIY